MTMKRNSMIKKLIKIVVSSSFALTFLVPMSVVNAVTTYDITFRAGAHGDFSGESKVVYTEEYNAQYPTDPYDAGLLTVDEGYAFIGWDEVLPSRVDGAATYVAKYTPIINGVEYRIRYVDQNDVDLVTPRIMIGELGSEVTQQARNINDYPVDQAEKSIVLGEDNNVITFVYTVPEDEVQPEYITEVITEVVDQVTTVPGTATGTTTPAGGAGAGTGTGTGDATTPGEGTGDDTTTIEDGDTPLADGGDETTDIEDGDTPLADGQQEESSNNNTAIIIGGIAVVVIIGIAIYLKTKKKPTE